jgi:opacity protein-like surface antigen
MKYFESKRRRVLPVAIEVIALFFVLLLGVPYLSAQNEHEDCIPRVTAAIEIDCNLTDDAPSDDTTTDWADTGVLRTRIVSSSLEGDNVETLFAIDSDYLYFYTEVETALGDIQSHVFFLAIGPTPHRMFQILPFSPGDVAPLGPSPVTNTPETNLSIAWDGWTAVDIELQRQLINFPVEKWILEGKIRLSEFGIADPNIFDLFLHVSMGDTKDNKIYWPALPDPDAFVDLSDPNSTSFDFHSLRCGNIVVTKPYINFGKMYVGSTSTPSDDFRFNIENDGTTGSSLTITGIDDPTTPFSIISVMKGTDSIPAPYSFELAHSETATVTAQYQPTTETTISAPHSSAIIVHSEDPDPGERDKDVTLEGGARKPIAVSFILDQSGSMTLHDKWVTTEWATEIAVEILRIFKLGQDKMAAVGFGGPSSSPQWYPLSVTIDAIGDPEGGSYTSSFADANSSYYTPIGYGIEGAHNRFSALTPDPTNWRNICILMSDGKHNRPTSTSGAIDVPGLSLTADVSSNVYGMEIHTVAVGHDSVVSTELLDAIATYYGGTLGGEPSSFNITENTGELARLFIGAVMDSFILNRIPSHNELSIGGEFDFSIESDAEKVVAMVAWPLGTVTTPQHVQFQVWNDTGTTFIQTYTDGSDGYYKGSDMGEPYTYIVFDEPFEQNVTLKIKDSSGNDFVSGSVFPIVLVDLNIKAVFSVGQAANGTGQDIILKAKLTEVGRPIINTPEHPVDVAVQIAAPGEAFGTFISTHNLEDCIPREPTLPPIDRDSPIGKDKQASVSMGIKAPPAGQDTPPQQFDTIAKQLEICGKEKLDRLELPGLKLYDDNTHGDELANDGIYTLRFNNTQYEGSYVFRFNVRGVSPTGAKFTRTRTISRYVRVNVEPDNSKTGSREVDRAKSYVSQQVYVIPRDRFNGYLGPGHSSQVTFNTNIKEGFSGPKVDHGNGIYSRILRYNELRDRPKVTIEVQGKTFKPVRIFKAVELTLPFAGYTWFDSALELKNGPVVGAKLGYRLLNFVTLEAEAGFGFTEKIASDEKGNWLQLMANLRFDLPTYSAWKPFLTAGAGYVLFSGFNVNDEAFVYQGGCGVTYKVSNSFGLRFDARVLRLRPVFLVPETTSFQATGGLVFWL